LGLALLQAAAKVLIQYSAQSPQLVEDSALEILVVLQLPEARVVQVVVAFLLVQVVLVIKADIHQLKELMELLRPEAAQVVAVVVRVVPVQLARAEMEQAIL
jgi:hypothetical protein